MGDKEWTPEREAAVLAAAEEGIDLAKFGPPVANPLRKVGRPSLSASGGTSKTLNARIPAELHGQITALADQEGRSVSDLTRDALGALLGEVSAPARSRTPTPRSKSDLVDVVAQRLGGRAVAVAAVDAVLTSIMAALAQGERVAIVGFGTIVKSEEGADIRVTPARTKKVAPRSGDGGAGSEGAGGLAPKARRAPKQTKARKAG